MEDSLANLCPDEGQPALLGLIKGPHTVSSMNNENTVQSQQGDSNGNGDNSRSEVNTFSTGKRDIKIASNAGVDTISSESIDNDFFDEIPAAPASNWLSKKTTETSVESKESGKPTNMSVTGGSLLGSLPTLPGRSLPPLGNVQGNKKDTDFMKLLSDSLEKLDSATDEDSSIAPGLSPKSNGIQQKSFPSLAKLEKQKIVDDQQSPTGNFMQKSPEKMTEKKKPITSADFFKKASSLENDVSSVSEEIVEDLEVDDLLDTGRSSGNQISF